MGLSFIFIILSFLSGLVFSNFGAAQTKSNDVERKADINALYQKLEEYFNENGDYPTVDAVSSKYETIFPGIDIEAFVDPNGNRINEGGDYTYTPSNCTAIGCAEYTLSAQLEAEDPYTKQSLN